MYGGGASVIMFVNSDADDDGFAHKLDFSINVYLSFFLLDIPQASKNKKQ